MRYFAARFLEDQNGEVNDFMYVFESLNMRISSVVY